MTPEEQAALIKKAREKRPSGGQSISTHGWGILAKEGGVHESESDC